MALSPLKGLNVLSTFLNIRLFQMHSRKNKNAHTYLSQEQAYTYKKDQSFLFRILCWVSRAHLSKQTKNAGSPHFVECIQIS